MHIRNEIKDLLREANSSRARVSAEQIQSLAQGVSPYAPGQVNRHSDSISFMRKVETHLHERENHIPKPFSDVPSELRTRMQSSSSFLANYDTRALKAFSGYLSGLSYDKKARFIATASDSLQETMKLSQLHRKA